MGLELFLNLERYLKHVRGDGQVIEPFSLIVKYLIFTWKPVGLLTDQSEWKSEVGGMTQPVRVTVLTPARTPEGRAQL